MQGKEPVAMHFSITKIMEMWLKSAGRDGLRQVAAEVMACSPKTPTAFLPAPCSSSPHTPAHSTGNVSHPGDDTVGMMPVAIGERQISQYRQRGWSSRPTQMAPGNDGPCLAVRHRPARAFRPIHAFISPYSLLRRFQRTLILIWFMSKKTY